VQKLKWTRFGTRISSNSDVWLPPVRKCRLKMRPFRPGGIKGSVPTHAKIYCKHVLRPTKVRLARAKQRPFSTPVIKTLRLKVRVRLDQRAPQIKRSKLIERFACRPSVNNNRRASRAGYLRHPPASRLLLTPVCRMLSQRKTSVSQIAVDWTARQRVGPNSYSLLCEVTYCRE
jgi:hypothetical protein